MTTIKVERFTEDHLKDFVKLSEIEYGPSISTNENHVRWKHLLSPFGSSHIVKLIEGDLVVGRALVQHRPMLKGYEIINVASVMDMLIDREHRTSPANFIKITKATGNIDGVVLIFHTANEKTLPLYSRLLRFHHPFSLRAYGFPVKISGLLFKLIGFRINAIDWLIKPFHWLLIGIASLINLSSGLSISDKTFSDDELDAITLKSINQDAPHLLRTNSFLKWRFYDTEMWKADLKRIDVNGKFSGYIVTRKMELGELTYYVLMDFILDPNLKIVDNFSLRFWLLTQAIKNGTDALFTLVNPLSIPARKFVGFPFLPIPDTLLPHATPIFMRPCNDRFRCFELDSSMHMTLADLDYF